VFWAVRAVIALAPYTPSAEKVFRSAWIPAPPPLSEPAIVSAIGVGSIRRPNVGARSSVSWCGKRAVSESGSRLNIDPFPSPVLSGAGSMGWRNASQLMSTPTVSGDLDKMRSGFNLETQSS
jgi:hypothetical protein